MSHFLSTSLVESFLPSVLLLFLNETRKEETEFCLAGGTVRDLLLSRKTKDIDLTVPARALHWAKKFAEFSNGTFVLLDEDEGVGRVVAGEHQIDFTEYRKGSLNLEDDLRLRDLTINAMGARLTVQIAEGRIPLVDPTGGYNDLQNGIIRFTSEQSIIDDPLRMLRAYRFSATLGFAIEPLSRDFIRRRAHEIWNCAGERINYELNCLLSSPSSCGVLRCMAQDGFLAVIIPEIADMQSVEQNGYHNANVYEHTFKALDFIEKIISNPAHYFDSEHIDHIEECLASDRTSVLLKWAALFHDVGKPQTAGNKGGRITFYRHDQVGAEIFSGVAERLKWSRRDGAFIAKMILLHMRPFHLVNVLRVGRLTPRAVSRLVRDAGIYLIPLFVLAMADSLAGLGPLKPVDTETLLLELSNMAMTFQYQRSTLQALPRLLTGKDLIEEFHLEPGPLFRNILEELETVQIAGQVHTRDEAVSFVEEMLKKGSDGRH